MLYCIYCLCFWSCTCRDTKQDIKKNQKVLSSNGNQVRLSAWWDDAENAIDDAIDDATDWAEASSSNGNQALLSSWWDDATDWAEDLFDDGKEVVDPIVTPVEDLIDNGTGPIKFTETIDFDLKC